MEFIRFQKIDYFRTFLTLRERDRERERERERDFFISLKFLTNNQ